MNFPNHFDVDNSLRSSIADPMMMRGTTAAEAEHCVNQPVAVSIERPLNNTQLAWLIHGDSSIAINKAVSCVPLMSVLLDPTNISIVLVAEIHHRQRFECRLVDPAARHLALPSGVYAARERQLACSNARCRKSWDTPPHTHTQTLS